MRKYFLCALMVGAAYSSNALEVPNSKQCPETAPMFSSKLGLSLIEQWGKDALFYSSYSRSGEYATDIDRGAALFTERYYLGDSVLLPTVSSITRQGPQNIFDYFTSFLSHGPHMTLPEQSGGPYVTLQDCGYGVISGYYNFTYQDGTPQTRARFTFQFSYKPDDNNVSITLKDKEVVTTTQHNGWYINLQNSAQLPSTKALPRKLLY